MIVDASVVFGILVVIFLGFQYRNTTSSIDRFAALCREHLDKVRFSADDVAMRFKLLEFELLCLVGMCVAFIIAMVQIFALAVTEGKISGLKEVIYLLTVVNLVLIAMSVRRLWLLEHTKDKILG